MNLFREKRLVFATNMTAIEVSGGDIVSASERNKTRDDIIRNAGDFDDTTGSATAYVLSLDSTNYIAYNDGDKFRAIIDTTNTGSATLNVNTIGAKAILNDANEILTPGELQAGRYYDFIFDATLDSFCIISSSPIDIVQQFFDKPRIQLQDVYNNISNVGGTTAYLGAGINLTTQIADAAQAYTTIDFSALTTAIYNKNPIWFARVALIAGATSGDEIMGLWDQSAPNANWNGTLTDDHAAFIVDDAAIYASVADGTTQDKSADLSGSYPTTDFNEYCIKKDGSIYRFYINGVNVHNSSGNEPNSDLSLATIGTRVNGATLRIIKAYQHSISFDE